MVNHPHAIVDEHASRSNAFGAVHLHRSATANGDGGGDGDNGSGSDGGGDTRCGGGSRIATGDGKRTGHSPKHSLGSMPATNGIGVQSRHPGKLLIDNGEEVMLSSEFVFEGKRHLLSEMLARRLAPAPPQLEHVRVCFCSVVAMLTPGSDLGRVDLLSMVRAGSMNRSEGDEADETSEGALNGSVCTAAHSWDVGGSSEESDGGWENGATKMPKPKMSAVVPVLNVSTIVPSMARESAGNKSASYDSSSPGRGEGEVELVVVSHREAEFKGGGASAAMDTLRHNQGQSGAVSLSFSAEETTHGYAHETMSNHMDWVASEYTESEFDNDGAHWDDNQGGDIGSNEY